MLRRTKIVTTIGPASENEDVLEQLLLAGANVIRLDFSQADAATQRKRVQLIRALSARHSLTVAILGDLQGPNISVHCLEEAAIDVKVGEILTIECQPDNLQNSNASLFCTYEQLIQDCAIGDHLVVGDGAIHLRITDIQQQTIKTIVESPGTITHAARLNKLGGGLTAAAVTTQDYANIDLAIELGCEFLAVSFVTNAQEIKAVKQLLRKKQSNMEVITKVERAELANDHQMLDEVIKVSDGVMVARVELGLEIGEAKLIGIQKYLIRRARELNRVVITAAQMMESMIHHPVPTRAEVFDVANAVLDGTDAVMCSNETAFGDYPVETVKTMADICIGAEQEHSLQNQSPRSHDTFTNIDEAIAMSVMYAANHLRGVKAIICLTESGGTPKWMSRIRSDLPIYALSRNEMTQRRCVIYRGVEPIHFDVTKLPPTHINRAAVDLLKERNIVSDGDLIIISKGDHMGVLGGTNSLKIVCAGNIL